MCVCMTWNTQNFKQTCVSLAEDLLKFLEQLENKGADHTLKMHPKKKTKGILKPSWSALVGSLLEVAADGRWSGWSLERPSVAEHICGFCFWVPGLT